MLQKLAILVFGLPLILVILIINLGVLYTTETNPQINTNLAVYPLYETGGQITASAGSGQVLSASIIAEDARSLLLQNFLSVNSSPMAPYASDIVRIADENKIDYRLIVAIAMCESNLGKRMPSRDSYNAWGIAVYNGDPGEGRKFKNGWLEAINWVSAYIKEKYYDRGIYDLQEIGAIWAPPSVEKGHSWSNCVASFQSSIL